MPYTILENAYATLTEVEQREVVDFVMYLISRKQKQTETPQSPDFSFVDNMFGTLSNEEADEMRKCSNLHFKETI